MAGRIALAAGLLMVWASVARAAPPPLIVFHSAEDAEGARVTLAAAAARNGTAFVDLSPRAEPPPKAGQLLSRAIDAYQDLRYEEALARVDEGLAEAANTGALGLSATDLADLMVYRGLVLGEQGNSAGAWDDFVRAAVVDPTRKLDPVRFAPRVAETFQRAVEAVQKGKKSEVTIEAPSECKARFDGREVTPRVPLPAAWGEHYLRVECAGSRPYGARVVVSEVAQVLRPALLENAAVSVADAAKLARKRGAASLLLAVVTSSPDAAATLRLQLVDAATAKGKDSVVVGVGGDIAAAAQRLIDQVVNPAKPVGPVTPPTPWYEKPWVWGVAGAAVASAVLLPFVLDSEPGNTFDIEPVLP
jgi:hypothetical protein